MSNREIPFSIAILAGGQSRRMGQNKALINLLGKPVLQWVIDAVASLSDDIFLVTNTPENYRAFQLPMVGDIFPGNAALGGIHTAVATARHSWVMLLACDMPLIRADIVRAMAAQRGDADVVVPRIAGRAEPLHALYRKTCRAAIEASLAAQQLRVIHFFEAVTVRYISPVDLGEPNFNFLTNLNTPEDLQRVTKILENQQT